MTTGQSETVGAWLVLYSLKNCGPARARWLASHPAGLSGALSDLRRGDVSALRADRPRGLNDALLVEWTAQANKLEPGELFSKHLSTGTIVCPTDEIWPFHNDPEPPLFLHAIGHSDLLRHRPTVGIVGTRRCTSVGRRTAAKLGSELAEAGVAVVSGLAKGVDGAAHAGCISVGGPAIAVVASGLDVVYPRSNQRLWHQVANDGLLLTEAPLGVRPDRWRFPARNRIIAALSDFVVVVESHAKGGALSTAEEASIRGVSVGAVPGSVVSPASAGTNALLVDGAIPIRHTQDVLDSLGIFRSLPQSNQEPLPGFGMGQTAPTPVAQKAQMPIGRKAQSVMDELQAGSLHFDALAASTGMALAELLALINELAIDGLVLVDGSTVVAADQSLTASTDQLGL